MAALGDVTGRHVGEASPRMTVVDVAARQVPHVTLLAMADVAARRAPHVTLLAVADVASRRAPRVTVVRKTPAGRE